MEHTNIRGNFHAVLNNSFVKALFTYNLVLYVMFFGVYSMIDFPKHFNLPNNTNADTGTVAYYTLMCQTQVMAGEITPKTQLSRALVGIHVFFSWFVVALIMVPWATPT